ncbi:unnamed protein product [Schistosoma mattheei]|uniref:phosphogluconate dehydrogenase (NADP(+)-dependent, decarboxylating) n=1 Tax=Schistosoma mattheei TaxID=31246 RepID=A0A3P8CQF8_9TREM|nr:unnamed protein product [Schistosoma mattheei]
MSNLLLDPFFKKVIDQCEDGWRRVVSHGALNAIPTPVFSSALSFYDGIKCPHLPSNLIQSICGTCSSSQMFLNRTWSMFAVVSILSGRAAFPFLIYLVTSHAGLFDR